MFTYILTQSIDVQRDCTLPVGGDLEEVDTADVLAPHGVRVNQLTQTLEHVLRDVRNHGSLSEKEGPKYTGRLVKIPRY